MKIIRGSWYTSYEAQVCEDRVDCTTRRAIHPGENSAKLGVRITLKGQMKANKVYIICGCSFSSWRECDCDCSCPYRYGFRLVLKEKE